MYGIKNPEIETKQTIIDYAKSIDLDTSAIVTVDTSQFLPIFKRIQLSIPEAEIFSANGDNLSYKEGNQDCNARLFSFIPKLKHDTILNKKDDFKLKDQMKNLRDLNGNNLNLEDSNNPDFYLFIYWVKWIGKLNKDHVKEWENLARSNKNAKIEVFEVNLDFQNWWSDNFRQKIISAMSNKSK
jgi:hypothetical protein